MGKVCYSVVREQRTESITSRRSWTNGCTKMPKGILGKSWTNLAIFSLQWMTDQWHYPSSWIQFPCGECACVHWCVCVCVCVCANWSFTAIHIHKPSWSSWIFKRQWRGRVTANLNVARLAIVQHASAMKAEQWNSGWVLVAYVDVDGLLIASECTLANLTATEIKWLLFSCWRFITRQKLDNTWAYM
jgi:hypothetical protein